MDDKNFQELEAKVTDLTTKLDTALEALDKMEEIVDAKVKAALESVNQTVNSVTVDSPTKPTPLVDPGVVTIDKAKYKFQNLKFSVPTENVGLVDYTAEEVAKDPKLTAELFKSHPSIFVKVTD